MYFSFEPYETQIWEKLFRHGAITISYKLQILINNLTLVRDRLVLQL